MDGLALQVCSAGNLSLLLRLIEAHSVSGARDAEGNSLLHIAAREGHLDVCQELLQRDPTCLHNENHAGDLAVALATAADIRALLGASVETVSADEGEDASLDAGEERASLEHLPLDIAELVLFEVASEGVLPVLRLRAVCQRLKDVTSSERLWERLCWSHHKLLRRSFLSGSWREMFMEHAMFHGKIKQNTRSAQERDRRFLDRRERAGLSSVPRDAVEGTIWDTGDRTMKGSHGAETSGAATASELS